MLRLRETTPTPEITACKVAALFGIVTNKREDVLVETVATLRRGIERELETVARITELLHHKGFLYFGTDSQVPVNIILGIRLGP